MTFFASLLSYDDSLRNTILDYTIGLQSLKPEDSFFEWTSINSNYSLTGYEMILNRNSLKYIVNYYLPSGEYRFQIIVIVEGKCLTLLTLYF